MKTQKLIIFITLFIISSLICTIASAETNDNDVKQKITTPPLELTTEEDVTTEIEVKSEENTNNQIEQPEGNEVQNSRTNEKEGPEDKQIEEKIPKTTLTPEAEFTPIQVKTTTKLEIIVDASGSMNGLIGSTTKMNILKDVLKETLTQPLPDGVKQEVGLRAYGNRKKSDENDCNDTELLIPIGNPTQEEIKDKINNLVAQGITPIGKALEEAANDFNVSPDSDNVILLLTDGEDSCEVDVCTLAKNLHESPKKIIINVIGFDLDQKSSKAIECIAKNSDGKFLQARSESELITSLDQILMANVPYNLRIKILVGATPIPSNLVVYKSRTKNMVREDNTSGIKYYQLPPGTYDIEVTYMDSPEEPKPKKIVRKIEVQATSKAEQIIQFDLGALTVSTLDKEGNPVKGTYSLQNQSNKNIKAKIEAGPDPKTIFLTPGTYNAEVEAITETGLTYNASAKDIKVQKDGNNNQEFKFEVAQIILKGKNSSGENVDLKFMVTPAGKKESVVLEGIASKEGRTMELPPGKYDIYYNLDVTEFLDMKFNKLGNVELISGGSIEKEVEIPTATLLISGKNAEEKLINISAFIKQTDNDKNQMIVQTEKNVAAIELPPGKYNIRATFTDSEITPSPVISWENVVIPKGQILEKVAYFKFGQMKLEGKTSKQAPVSTNFFVYKTGGSEPITTLLGILEPRTITVTEGFYDIKAEDASAINEIKPSIWAHNVEVNAKQEAVVEAIFTHGKIKMVCRGPNDITLNCLYRVYSYGKDSPLFEGETSETWKEYEIPPGNYYIEAGYHDEVDEVLLKKWISIRIEDNEMLEQLIRF